MAITLDPIGVIHSSHKSPKGTPIQPTAARGVQGWADIRAEIVPGLADLEGFSHLILLYLFHRTKHTQLCVCPFMDDAPHGVLATRAPVRPNHVGLSVVRLQRIEGSVVHLLDVDVVDGAPLLDIKPYVPAFDTPQDPVRVGWLEDRQAHVSTKRAHDRFVHPDSVRPSTKIDHVGLWVKDLEAVATFYVANLDGELSSEYHNARTGFRSRFVTFGSGCRLELMQRPDVQSGSLEGAVETLGYAHLALNLGSHVAVDQAVVRLEQGGSARISGPRVTGDGYYEAVIMDPEGNRIEIVG